MTIAGLAICLSSVGWLALGLIRHVEAVGVLHYEPTWMLAHQVSDTQYVPADIAQELLDRLDRATLSQSQINAIADRALQIQNNPAASPVAVKAANYFVEFAHRTKQLDRDRWKAFAAHAFSLSMVARPIVRQGDSLPVLICAEGLKLNLQTFVIYLDFSRFQIDGKDAVAYKPSCSEDGHENAISAWAQDGGDCAKIFDPSNTTSLLPGDHLCKGIVKATVYNVEDVARYQYNHPNNPLNPKEYVVQFATELAGSFKVYDASHEPSLFNTDPSLKQAVDSAIQLSEVIQYKDGDSSYLCMPLQFGDGPLPLCFELFVRKTGSTSWDFTTGGYEVVYSHEVALTPMHLRGDLGDAKFADVWLRPNPNGFRESVKDFHSWGGDVIFHNLPVSRYPSP